ncbi:MAG: aminotransferase class III-fold pyridoxal phosphate-dependent enzyme [Candidatus Kapabacteria bacterium]|nr:aminotransferase class III-fold pyridoxal phosphate-dependent enzyme [Candidatus Kapabacteria bacterium]
MLTLPTIQKSMELYDKARRIIPATTQTLAKGVGQYSLGVAPIFVEKGKGSKVFDIDGNEYLDLSMAVGPISLGYCYEAVDAAIKEQLSHGITFSLPHIVEYEVSELISSIVPNAEMIRFSKTGADVTSAAVRLARAYTQRDEILCCGYHGWHDWYIGVTDRNYGIPEATKNQVFTFDYNNVDSLLDSICEKTAAVILEPITFTEPKKGFLLELRELCHKYGAVLIFDEMWTGWRLALGGAQEYYDIDADILCFSKAIANGMPLSVLCGKSEIMKLLEKDVFFFTTFGGEALSLAAAKTTIVEMRKYDVPDYLRQQGKKLQYGIKNIIQSHKVNWCDCIGNPTRTMMTFHHSVYSALELKTLMQQELIRYGILWNGFHTLSFSHSDQDIHHALLAYGDIIPWMNEIILNGNVKNMIVGKVLEPVFRKTTHFNTKPHVVHG